MIDFLYPRIMVSLLFLRSEMLVLHCHCNNTNNLKLVIDGLKSRFKIQLLNLYKKERKSCVHSRVAHTCK